MCCTYHIIWKKFNQFFVKLDSKPRAWEDCLTLFTGYMVDKGFKSTTIRSYISAMKSVLSEIKVKLNIDQSLISSLTRVCKLTNDCVKTRLPIHKDLLQLILNMIKSHYESYGQQYLSILYQALFSTAYYGLFRVRELTFSQHIILAKNVHIAINKNK